MKKQLKLIIIEDSEPDTLLLVRELHQHGYEVGYRRVKDSQTLAEALDSEAWDMIISDYSLPNFSGLKALKTVKEKKLDIPFLMMSGIITEDMAVEALRAGASDFFSKGKLARLIPAIERELREAQKRRLHKEVEQQLHRSEERFIKTFHSNPLAIMICTLADEFIVDVNMRFLELLNYSHSEVIGQTVDDLAIWANTHHHIGIMDILHRHSTVQEIETQFRTKDHDLKDVLLSIETIELNGKPCMLAMIRDITERKRIQKAEQEQRILAEALRDTALALSHSLELSQVLDYILDNLVKVIEYDAASIVLKEDALWHIMRIRGYSKKQLPTMPLAMNLVPAFKTVIETKRPVVISNTQTYSDWVDIFEGVKVLSYIGIPIIVREEVIGLLSLDSFSPAFFSQKYLHGLELFAAQAAVAIQNAQLYQRAQELAIIEERQRLSNDLHDAVSQMLFTSCVIADALPRLMTRNPDKVPHQLEQLRRLNRGALAEMRKLLLELHSELLVDVELQKLLQQLAQAAMGHTHIDVIVEVSVDYPLVGDRKIALYRIAQEALNNIIKHAQATSVTIRLLAGADLGELAIIDNGQGFEVGNASAEHMGLSIMEKRAEQVGAYLVVNSTLGSGTEVKVTWKH